MGPANGGSRRPLELLYPADGSTISRSDAAEGPPRLTLIASGGAGPYRWRMPNGQEISTASQSLAWTFGDRGQFEVEVIDAHGAVAHSSFWLD